MEGFKDAKIGNPFIAPKDGRCLINNLPPELLSYIFLLGTPEYEVAEEEEEEEEEEEDDGYDEDNDDEEEGGGGGEGEEEEGERNREWEILVSHVCRRWREVALQTPALWTTVDFDNGLEKTHVYLDRSQNAPLMLSLDLTLSENDEDDEEDEDDEAQIARQTADLTFRLARTLPLIIPHVGHWRLFELMVSDYHLMHMALRELGKCAAAPILDDLRLYVHDDTEECEEFSPPLFKQQNFVLFHGNAPKLTRVTLWGVHLNWAESRFLSGLLEFELVYLAKDVRPSFKDVARIFHDSPELNTLIFDHSGPAGGPVEWLASMSEGAPEGEPVSTTLQLPSVDTLVLAFLEPQYVTPLVERLALPNLVHLALDFEEDDFSEFLCTLARPAPATGKALLAGLDSLKVSGLPSDDASIAEALGVLANVQSLTLHFGYIEEAWFTYLVAPPPQAAASTTATGARVFCPRLAELKSSGIDGDQMVALVRARKDAGVPIRWLLMNEDDCVGAEDAEWLQQNVESFKNFEGSDEEDVGGSDLEIEEGDEEDDDWEDMED